MLKLPDFLVAIGEGLLKAFASRLAALDLDGIRRRLAHCSERRSGRAVGGFGAGDFKHEGRVTGRAVGIRAERQTFSNAVTDDLQFGHRAAASLDRALECFPLLLPCLLEICAARLENVAFLPQRELLLVELLLGWQGLAPGSG